jgi:single-stranded-DNA-specific exonuclease
LRELGPWGQGFPEPSFDGEFEILQQRMLGAKHLKLVLCPPGCRQQALDAIAFNVDPALWATCNVARISAVYRLDVNEYRGQRSLQLVLEHLAPSSYLAER